MRNRVNRTMVDNITSPVGGVRRRGNVMLFVIFILGTLFAASMAFLALMRTEAGVMTSRRDQGKLDVIIGGLSYDLVLGSARSPRDRSSLRPGCCAWAPAATTRHSRSVGRASTSRSPSAWRATLACASRGSPSAGPRSGSEEDCAHSNGSCAPASDQPV